MIVRRILLVILVILAGVMLIAGSIVTSEQVKKRSVTAFSERAFGLSTFLTLAQRVGAADSLTVIRAPLLDPRAIEGVDVILLFSPLTSVSAREARLLAEWVKKGGTLVASFHDTASLGALGSLVEAFGSAVDEPSELVARAADYRTGETLRIVPTQAVGPFEKGLIYEVYASQRFDDPKCPHQIEACYVKEWTRGEGRFLLVVGIPPIANGMIGRSSNRQVAFWLLDGSRTVAIDEYHHLFTERTLKDLFLEPRVILPLVGFILTMIAFLRYGRTSIDESFAPDPQEAAVTGYHYLNEGIFRSLAHPRQSALGALEAHRGFLVRLFPAATERIDEVARRRDVKPLRIGRMLIDLHQELLAERRGGGSSQIKEKRHATM